MFTYKMPICPPLSACFTNPRGRKGRVPTGRYTKWQKHAAEVAFYVNNGYRPDHPMSRIQVTVRCAPVALADIDNRFKASIDFLVKQRIIEDDKYPHMIAVHGIWDESLPKGEMILEVMDA